MTLPNPKEGRGHLPTPITNWVNLKYLTNEY
jgi:hypothetical protein